MPTKLTKLSILFTIILMDILTGMEFDLFVPSFPHLQSHFHLSPFWVEATLSANFIGYCLSLFLVGDLSDRLGRKPIILLGLALFIIGSLLCIWPPSFPFLLLGRLIQGIGIAAPSILSFLIIADAYPLKEQQYLMTMLNGFLNIAVGVAPVIGSYVTLYFSWQGNFAFLFILGFLVFLMTVLFIPSSTAHKQREALSLQGIAGYIEIFKTKELMLLITFFLFLFLPYWIFVGMSPLLYIKSLGVPLSHFGYYQGVLALVFAIGTLMFGLIIKHATYAHRQYVVIEFYLLIPSLIIILIPTLVIGDNPLFITLAMLPFIIAQIPSNLLYTLFINYLPHAKGRLSALLQGARLVLTAISLQIAGHFYTGTFQNIGIMLSAFILGSIICLYFVIHNQKLMRVLN